MIPLFAVLGYRTRKQRYIRLWLPLFIIWLLLLPLILVLLPFAIGACRLVRVNPWRSISAGWQLLAGLRGTHLELDGAEHYVLVHIY